MKHLKTLLGEMAKVGLVVAVSKPIYQNLKQQDTRKARMTVREFTRHNDKLGFDYSIKNNGYYISRSKQFRQSSYGGPNGFLTEAAAFYSNRNEATASHFTTMAGLFTMDASDGVQRDFLIPDTIQDTRKISGYIQQIESLDLQLRNT
jgi:hypothetical protein